MQYPKVSIIVVNFNGEKYLKGCLDSIFSLNYPKSKLEIIVVDNGSSDNSISIVKNNFPKVKMLNNDENNYCKANNLGIKESSGEYVAIVNNDVEVCKDWLLELVKKLSNYNTIAAAMGKVLFKNGLLQSTGHYELPNFYWGDRGFMEEDKGQFDSIEEINSISNTGSLYKRNVFDRVGLFDEDFEIYMEDVDFGIRCKEYNLKFLYVPAAICYHEFHGTNREDFVRFKIEKNRLLLVAKHYPDKLGDVLFGEGYFQVNKQKDEKIDIFKIFPEILLKLLKHHPLEKVNLLLPGIFKELSKFVNYDRYYLVQRLRDFETNFNKSIFDKENGIKQLREALSEKVNEIKNLNKDIDDKSIIIDVKDKGIVQSQKLLNFKGQYIKQLGKVISEKDSFIKQLGKVISEKEMDIGNINKNIAEANKIIESKNSEILQQCKLINKQEIKMIQLGNLIEHQRENLKNNQQIINQKAEELSRLNEIIAEKEEKLQYFYTWMERFYNSETYRFLLKPFWAILVIFKKLLKIGEFSSCQKIVIIKPSIISVSKTAEVIKRIKSENRNSKVTLVAFFKNDIDGKELRLLAVDRKITLPAGRKLSNVFQLIKLFMILIFRGAHQSYILVGSVLDKSYRKFKLLAFLTKTKSIKLYMIDNNRQIQLSSLTKTLLLLFLKSASLYLLILFFIIFIAGRTKLSQIFRKLTSLSKSSS